MENGIRLLNNDNNLFEFELILEFSIVIFILSHNQLCSVVCNTVHPITPPNSHNSPHINHYLSQRVKKLNKENKNYGKTYHRSINYTTSQ